MRPVCMLCETPRFLSVCVRTCVLAGCTRLSPAAESCSLYKHYHTDCHSMHGRASSHTLTQTTHMPAGEPQSTVSWLWLGHGRSRERESERERMKKWRRSRDGSWCPPTSCCLIFWFPSVSFLFILVFHSLISTLHCPHVFRRSFTIKLPYLSI